jgi:nitroimidazol reductase NimA-like FMN-containing flavoprotein (pyridoxamine 5'-phosphate oxidase superfamily)
MQDQKSGDVIEFLERHDSGVLSTVDSERGVTAAPMYYSVQGESLFIITKNSTRKARNMTSHPNVAFTVYDPATLQVAQIQAQVETVDDWNLQEQVYQAIMQPHEGAPQANVPPVASVRSGAYAVFRIVPSTIAYSDFRQW